MILPFHNFHSHDGMSFLDGMNTPKQYIDRAMELGLYGQGISNHGNCVSIIEYYKYGKKVGFPVTLGEEFYVEDESVIFAPKEERKNLNWYYHLIVIAKNKVGYENLMKLSSLAFDPDRFYRRPRISFQDLFQNKEGLIVTSACLGGPVALNIMRGNHEKAFQIAQMFKREFGDDWFLEIEAIDTRMEWDSKKKLHYDSGVNHQETVNRTMLLFSKDLDIEMVIGLDSHMIGPEYKEAQDVAIKTGSSGWYFYDTYCLKGVEDLWDDCQRWHPFITRDHFERMCNNTVEIADRCKNLELTFKPQLPKVEHNTIEDLYKIIIKKDKIPWGDQRYIDRLKLEIEVIHNNGTIDLIDYFFVVEDLVNWCNENNILVGPGRGSVCGSLLTYAMGITGIDPLKYDLLFERFLSLPRIEDGSLPDIDLDFSDPDRVKQYLRDKYGHDKVFSVGTVQQMGLKAAFTDVCRVILEDEFDYFKIKQLCKGLPSIGYPGADQDRLLRVAYGEEDIDDEKVKNFMSSDALTKSYDREWNTKWKEWINTHPKGHQIYKIMKKILGLPRQSGIHACAIAISETPMYKIMPTGMNKGVPVTQWTADWVEYAGIIKFDILGLNTLKDFQECIQMIYDRSGKTYDIYKFEVNDSRIFEEFEKGNTETIFQFHSPLQRRLLKNIGVSSLEDLALITAVARPGPLHAKLDELYAKGKKNPSLVVYEHPMMKEVVETTYGALVYQEQIMKFFNKVGGLTLVESEQVRRAISKFKYESMMQYKERFLEYTTTTLQPTMTRELAEKFWTQVEGFCSYSFNASHAIGYSYIAYVCMFFKIYYPIEWWCAVLKNCDSEDFKVFYKKVPIPLVTPDINLSTSNFYIDSNNQIVIPLSRIKQIGEKASVEIMKAQPYKSFDDFLVRVNKRTVKKNVVINLILAECFNSIDDRNFIDLIKYYFQWRKEEVPKEYLTDDRIEKLQLQCRALEFKTLDYLDFYPELKKNGYLSYYEIRKKIVGHGVRTIGRVLKKTLAKTKKLNPYCRVFLYNNNDKIKVTFWGKKYECLWTGIQEGDIIKVVGEIDNYGGDIALTGKFLEKIG